MRFHTWVSKIDFGGLLSRVEIVNKDVFNCHGLKIGNTMSFNGLEPCTHSMHIPCIPLYPLMFHVVIQYSCLVGKKKKKKEKNG